MRDEIERRAAQLRQQAEDTKREAEKQITALLTAAAELERLLTLQSELAHNPSSNE